MSFEQGIVTEFSTAISKIPSDVSQDWKCKNPNKCQAGSTAIYLPQNVRKEMSLLLRLQSIQHSLHFFLFHLLTPTLDKTLVEDGG